MRFSILGPIEVHGPDGAVLLGGAKQRAVLAALLLEANRPVAVAQLLSLLWGPEPPRSAPKMLQLYISQLRKLLEVGQGTPEVLLTRSPGYEVRVAPGHLDLDEFEERVRMGDAAVGRDDHEEASRLFGAALGLWRGAALADLLHEPFAEAASHRLEELRVTTMETRARCELELGRHEHVRPELESILAEHPTREPTAVLLMLALARAGRQHEALETFGRVRTALVEELGIDPGPELQQMHTRVLRQDPALRWAPSTAYASPHNVPVPVDVLIGRDDDLAAVGDLLDRARVVTLTGPGGCGKSRLAGEVAVSRSPDTPGGVWFLELAPLREPGLILSSLMTAMRLQPGMDADPARTVLDAIGSRDVLIVLDNCEHLIEESAATAERLLRGCPNLRVLTTSREALGIEGEHLWEVRALDFPTGEIHPPSRAEAFSAVRLFARRAAAVSPGFRVNLSNRHAVAHVCRSLDGLPLSLELAASLVRSMTVDQIADRLDDRFGLLVGNARSGPPHHRSLRRVLEWSHNLLDPEERDLFAQLSVFTGTFTLESVESVCDHAAGVATAPVLHRLIGKSLVSVRRTHDSVRYHLLETVRRFAQDQLATAPDEGRAVRQRHAQHFLHFAETAEDHLRGTDQLTWVQRLDAEWDNLRAAVTWAESHSPHEDARLATALSRACYLSGRYAEGRAWLATALRSASLPDLLRARCLNAAGGLAFYQCDYDEATTRCREATEVFAALDDEAGRAASLTFLGGIARERAEYETSLDLHASAQDLFERLADPWGVAHSLQLTGFASWLSGDLDRAESTSSRALDQFRALADTERAGWAALDLSVVALHRQDVAGSEALLDESSSAFDILGFKEGIAWARDIAAQLELARNRPDGAMLQFLAALALHRELGDRWRVSSVLEGLAAVFAISGAAGPGAHLVGAAAAVRDRIGTPVPTCERPRLADTLAILREVLGHGPLERALADGRSLDAGAACRLAECVASGLSRPAGAAGARAGGPGRR